MTRGAAGEGVIKFDLAFTPDAALPEAELRELIAWRTILWRLGLIGRDPARYGGAGFGNVSRRLPRPADARAPWFAISGTQTGALPALAPRHFAIVTACDPERNRVEARGPIAPSSESLTHGMLYRLDPAVAFVLHVHAPEIWRAAAALGLPRTAPEAAYGTPAMAREIERLMRAGAFDREPVLVMGGHEDGVIAFGPSADAAGLALLATLAAALTLH
ncbi:MAG TPA: class II aldolase/adducin family protein [Burkholderiales bacterium]